MRIIIHAPPGQAPTSHVGCAAPLRLRALRCTRSGVGRARTPPLCSGPDIPCRGTAICQRTRAPRHPMSGFRNIAGRAPSAHPVPLRGRTGLSKPMPTVICRSAPNARHQSHELPGCQLPRKKFVATSATAAFLCASHPRPHWGRGLGVRGKPVRKSCHLCASSTSVHSVPSCNLACGTSFF